ncbi:uncharacterized protein [Rutidosis leptorrhynchoides]|uniref:uncharacterized protein n=1 Tax=Rutidosis leptorrhynchoides TaxID=125765 RepID=UPI003A99D27B
MDPNGNPIHDEEGNPNGPPVNQELLNDPNDTPMWNARLVASTMIALAITKPSIKADNWKIEDENPFEHIQHFNDLCDIYKTKNVTDDAFKLRAFPFTLQGDAKALMRSLASNSIRSFQELTNEFINHFFPPSKVERLRMEINGFTQRGDKSLYDAWVRFKKLIRACPPHGLTKKEYINAFYRGCNMLTKRHLDSSSGGGLFKFLEDLDDATFIPYQVKSVMSMETTELSCKELKGDFEQIQLGKVDKELKVETLLNTKAQKNVVEVSTTSTKEKNETPVSHFQSLHPTHLNDVDYTRGQKGDVKQASTTFLKKECGGILNKCNLPSKMGDPGPFLIPCNVNGSEMLTSLADSGASINFMPYSVYKRLGLGDLSPTTMGVKLIDQSINSSMGIAEDLIVKVGDMEFPIEFVIVDIKEDPVVPLVLGRPFLATAGSFFDFWTGKLTLSMRKLFGRVHRASSKKDEHLRKRLVSNLSKHEKVKLKELINETKVMNDWLISMLSGGGNENVSLSSNGREVYHPGIS